MVFDPVYLLFGVVFFFLAWVIVRLRRTINNLEQKATDLKVRLEFAKNEVEFARTKYNELLEVAAEVTDSAKIAK